MAVAAATKTDTKPAPAAAPEKLRDVQPKKLVPSSLQSLGQDFDMLAVRIPADFAFDDILKPVCWANVANLVAKDAWNTRRDKIGSLIYARHEKGDFSAILIIESITLDQLNQANGLVLKPWLIDAK